MDDPEFRLHTDEETTYGLAPCTTQRLFPVALARIMGPTSDEKARELAGLWGYELEVDGHGRTLSKDGERHELTRLPTWKAVWVQIAPHVLKGVEPGDIRPNAVSAPEVARAYLYWRPKGGVSTEQLDAILGVSEAIGAEEEETTLEPDR